MMETAMETTGLLVTLDHGGARVLAYAVGVQDGRIRFGQGRGARERDLTDAEFGPHGGLRKLDEVNLLTDAAPFDDSAPEGFLVLDVPLTEVPKRPVKLSLYSIEKDRSDLVDEFSSGANYLLPNELRFASVLAAQHLDSTDPELLVAVWTLTEEAWSNLQQAR